MAKPWNNRSVVECCDQCNGVGYVAAHYRPTIDDPYPQTVCECGLGEHEPCCEVCGFTQIVRGFDCLACNTVDGLFPADLAKLDVAAFVEAFGVAVAAARADLDLEIARAAGSYVPQVQA